MEPKVNQPSDLYVVRLWDMFDGWMDITGPLSYADAEQVWNERTHNGTRNTRFNDGDYYKIYPYNTVMLFTPETMGR